MSRGFSYAEFKNKASFWYRLCFPLHMAYFQHDFISQCSETFLLFTVALGIASQMLCSETFLTHQRCIWHINIKDWYCLNNFHIVNMDVRSVWNWSWKRQYVISFLDDPAFRKHGIGNTKQLLVPVNDWDCELISYNTSILAFLFSFKKRCSVSELIWQSALTSVR